MSKGSRTTHLVGAFLMLALALAGRQSAAGEIPAAELACDSAVTGTIGAGDLLFGIDLDRFFVAADDVYDDADRTPVDLFGFDAEVGELISLRLSSIQFDTFLLLFGPDLEQLAANDDVAAGGTDSAIEFVAPVAGRYYVAVTGFNEQEVGDYRIELVCGSRGIDRALPAGRADEWSYLFGWDGFYWQPGSDRDAAVQGQGIAIDIQRGVLFGALYTYNGAGNEAFLTLQSTNVSADGRRYDGPVFRVRGGGSQVAEVGRFEIELIGRDGQRAIRFTIESPYLDQAGSDWIRFGFLDTDQSSPVAGARVLFELLVDDSTARDFLDTVGAQLLVDETRIALDPGAQVVAVAAARNPDFSGFLEYDRGLGRYFLTLERAQDPSDALLLEILADHNEWVGIGGVFIDGSLVASGDVAALTVATSRSAAKRRAAIAGLEADQLQAMRARSEGRRVALERARVSSKAARNGTWEEVQARGASQR